MNKLLDGRNNAQVVIEKYGTVAARRTPPEWMVSVTEPVRRILNNIDHETVNDADDPVRALKKSDERAVFIFNEPNDGRIDGVIKIGSDVPTGRSAKNARAITVNNTSLNIWFTSEEFESLGVDLGADANLTPVVEIWGGDNILSIRSPRVKEIAYHQSPEIGLYELPKQMREDFEAVHLGEYTAEEWAAERGLQKLEQGEPGRQRKVVVERNVNSAIKRLGDDVVSTLETRGEIDDDEMHGEEVTRDFLPAGSAQIRTDRTGYRVSITDAVRMALPDDEHDQPMSIMYDTLNGGQWGVPAPIEVYDTDEQAATGRGSDRVRKIQVTESVPGESESGYKHRVKLPETVLELLGYDLSHVDNKSINMLALEDERAIAFERPPRQTITVPEIEIVEISAAKRYTDAIGKAAADVGEPLSLREYEEWADQQADYYPSGVTIATSEYGPVDSPSWKNVCHAAGVEPGKPQYPESVREAGDAVDGVLTVETYESWREDQPDPHPSGTLIALLHEDGWKGVCEDVGVAHGDTPANHLSRYTDHLADAVEALGEPLTMEKYDTWRESQEDSYPSPRTISAAASGPDGWAQACEDAGVSAGQ